MDQVKIGKFIAKMRKEQKLTQNELAEKLNITDRAISKWENGKGLPDSSLMLELCNILKITVNELLIGEKVEMKEKEEKTEQVLMDMMRERENKDKELLKLEIVLGLLSTIILLVCIFIASFIDISNWLKITLIVFGIIAFIIGVSYAIRIEQIAGYYECQNCHNKYIPSYNKVMFAFHIGRSRKMKCPKCNKKNYHKKVIKI